MSKRFTSSTSFSNGKSSNTVSTSNRFGSKTSTVVSDKNGVVLSSTSSKTVNTSAVFNSGTKIILLLFLISLISIVFQWTDTFPSFDTSTTFESYHSSNIDTGMVHIESIINSLSDIDYQVDLTKVFGQGIQSDWGIFNDLRDFLNGIYTLINFLLSGINAVIQLVPALLKLIFG